MALERAKVRIKRKKVKTRRLTSQRTKVQERGPMRARRARGTGRIPIAHTFLCRMDVSEGVSVVFGMIVWIHRRADVLGAEVRITEAWSAQGLKEQKGQAVQVGRVQEKC